MIDENGSASSLEDMRIRVEEKRLILEDKKVEYDQENRRQDRETDSKNRAEEFALRREEIGRSNRSLTSAQVQILAAILSLASAAIGAGITGYLAGAFNVEAEVKKAVGLANVEVKKGLSAVELDKEQFESNLILKTITTNKIEGAIPLLKSYAKMGLIPTYEQRILTLADDQGGVGILVSNPAAVSSLNSFISSDVISVCNKSYDVYSHDPGEFVQSVAGQFGISLSNRSSEIIATINGPGWEQLPDGTAAAARARAGYLVIGGLRGTLSKNPSAVDYVVVVVDGPLAAGKYPSAFWGSIRGEGGRFQTLNWVWPTGDRDHVIYAAKALSVAAK